MSCIEEGMKCIWRCVSCRFRGLKGMKCLWRHVIYIKDINDLL
ncbi:Uncharacterised protein [Serratia entomophila]|nr:Uncharacterised protein [Serratia entomophila]CAI0696462.1 Uncharacterised protein [Serratia entomophila]CAI0697284.1 Uncharacterised protein [Serratia entomophila]CAI0882770.1 Uncharacterised protein [Serratia entomophila]CAI1525068.1 Uncharacterised protein [Serratia entomophila]